MTIDQFLVELGKVDEFEWRVMRRPGGLIRGYSKVKDRGGAHRLYHYCPIRAVYQHLVGGDPTLGEAIDGLALEHSDANLLMRAADERWHEKDLVRRRMLEILAPEER